ncbi:MAG TPA: hypothetical protein VME43_06620 [Bryobacteraceae bacterium]|nr:hypothetical protein [Bryobacteraceae bacterium]
MPNQTPTSVEPVEELARLREDLIAFYRPVGSQERLAVERIASARQSMLRAARLESSLFASAPEGELHTILATEGFKVFLRYQAQAERSYRCAVKELMDLRTDRLSVPAVPELPVARKPQPVPPPPAAASAAAASRGNAVNLALRL